MVRGRRGKLQPESVDFVGIAGKRLRRDDCVETAKMQPLRPRDLDRSG